MNTRRMPVVLRGIVGFELRLIRALFFFGRVEAAPFKSDFFVLDVQGDFTAAVFVRRFT